MSCATCGGPIPPRAHQARTARTCSPSCAGALYKRENPNEREILRGPGADTDEDDEADHTNGGGQ